MNYDDEKKLSVKEKVGMGVAALAVEAHHSAEPSIGMLSLKEMIYLVRLKSGSLPPTTAFRLTVGRSARHVTHCPGMQSQGFLCMCKTVKTIVGYVIAHLLI
jgi:hypothetical protein